MRANSVITREQLTGDARPIAVAGRPDRRVGKRLLYQFQNVTIKVFLGEWLFSGDRIDESSDEQRPSWSIILIDQARPLLLRVVEALPIWTP